MPNLPRLYRPPHLGPRKDAEAARQQALAKRRGTKGERGYNRQWEKASLLHRRENPLCVCHKANGLVKAAELVDHIIPHKGNHALFWDLANNVQSLCNWCHEHVKKPLEHLFAQGKCSAADLRLTRRFPEHFGC
jgi:5-methylcytosine-specific restriction endonuclease McrA